MDNLQEILTPQLLLTMEKKKRENELSRARSKAYYEKNKPQILQKRRQTREKEKQDLREISNRLAILNIQDESNFEPDFEPNFESNFEPNFDDLENEIIQPQPKTSNKKRDYTQQDLLTIINNTDWKKNTKSTYISSIKRIFRAGGCDTLKNCLNDMKKFIDNVNNDKRYGSSSKFLVYQALGKLFDDFNVGANMFAKTKEKQIKKQIESEYARWRDANKTETENKQDTMYYPTFTEHLKKVKDAFDENSKEYLIIYLYSILTVRDNYKAMKIISNLNENNGRDNFFYINQTSKKMIFFINDYKTKDKYDKIKFEISDNKLKKLLFDWIQTKKLKYGDYLFGKSPLSSFVSNINKAVGYTDIKGINAMRHMRVSQLYINKEKPTWEERRKLADEMSHSIMVQEKYRRNLIVS